MFEERYKLMYHTFLEIAQSLGHSNEHAADLIRMLPKELKELYSAKAHETQELIYSFGSPIDRLPYSGMVFGGQQMVPVSALYQALHWARKTLSGQFLTDFIYKLGRPEKHLSSLFEFRPLFFVEPVETPLYEVPGNKGKTIDWQIVSTSHVYRVEVKVRSGTVVKNMENILARVEHPERPMPLPPTDPVEFFKSIEEKFTPSGDERVLDGCWVFTGSCESKRVVDDYFQHVMDPGLVKFCIISTWDKKASLLARAEIDADELSSFFHVDFGGHYFY